MDMSQGDDVGTRGYTDMWMRRCSPCPVCGMRPEHDPGRSSHRISCRHAGSTVFGAEPLRVTGDSIQSAVSEWNTVAGRGWTKNGILKAGE